MALKTIDSCLQSLSPYFLKAPLRGAAMSKHTMHTVSAVLAVSADSIQTSRRLKMPGETPRLLSIVQDHTIGRATQDWVCQRRDDIVRPRLGLADGMHVVRPG